MFATDEQSRPPADRDLSLKLTGLSPRRAMAALSLDWLLVGVCFAVAICFPLAGVYVVTAIVIGRTQLALAVMMHEAAHGLLFRRRSMNDLVGQLFTAGPLMVSLGAYRFGHLKHHRAPMASDDPVALVFEIDDYPISRGRLVLRLARDLCGLSYFVTIGKLLFGRHRRVLSDARREPGRPALVLVSIVATNGLMLAALSAVGHPWLYVGLWLLPALTLLQVMGRVRAIMEHAGYLPGEDQRHNARTIVRPSWQTFLFGPHGVHFHIEHHQNVRVPFYRLPELHRAMASQGLLPAPNLYRGYGAILREVTRA